MTRSDQFDGGPDSQLSGPAWRVGGVTLPNRSDARPDPRRRGVALAEFVALLAADAAGGQEESELGHAALARRRARARRIRTLIEWLGPFYVKVGQILSTRTDIVSPTLADELALLHHSVTAAPFQDFGDVLDADLGAGWQRDLRDLRAAAPVGSASLAQVYRATGRDGGPIIVKVQRPGARARVLADMAALRKASRLAGRCLPRLDAVIDIEATLDVIFDAMRPELDFRLEAASMDRAREAAAPFDLVHVPGVVRATERVLVQTLAPGAPIGDPKSAALPAAVRNRIGGQLLAFMYRSYFRERTFHADPHPGNVFVDPVHGATLIDWGMVGRLDRTLSTSGALILTSLAQNDAHGFANAWISAGRLTPWADVPAFQDDMGRLVPRISAAALEHLDFGAALATALRQSARRGIRSNPMIGILGKSFANIEGSIRLIAPELSISEVFRETLADVVLELAKEMAAPEQAARFVLEALAGAAAAPDQLRTLLRDAAGQEATVRVGLLPGHGIGGEGRGMLTRYRPHLLAAVAGTVVLRRESRHLIEHWHAHAARPR